MLRSGERRGELDLSFLLPLPLAFVRAHSLSFHLSLFLGRTTAPTPLSPQTPLPTTPVKPFDWTYSSLHTGVHSFNSSSSSSTTSPTWRAALPTEIIPLALLSQPDPILFYDEIPLFESELDDNGTSTLSVRVVSLVSSHLPLFPLFFFIPYLSAACGPYTSI